MYFAVDPIKPGFPEKITDLLEGCRQGACSAPVYCYLLIDSSFNQNLGTAPRRRKYVAASLYEDTRLEGLKAVGPTLLHLPDDTQKQRSWLQDLIGDCAGMPMLSVFFSAIPADQLKIHFRPYLLAQTRDGLEWPVRWADTRVLPGLIDALSPDERQHLFAPLHTWLTVDRRGEVLIWQGGGSPELQTEPFDWWPLDETRFAKLLSDAEADAVLSQIDDKMPQLLARRMPADNHTVVVRQLALASQCRIESAASRLHFALLGLMHTPTLIDDPTMRALLQKVAQGADYLTEIGSLPANFWKQYFQGINP